MYCILIYPLRFKFIAAIIVTWFALSSPVKLLRTILGHHRVIQGDISSKMYSPLHSYNSKIKRKCNHLLPLNPVRPIITNVFCRHWYCFGSIDNHSPTWTRWVQKKMYMPKLTEEIIYCREKFASTWQILHFLFTLRKTRLESTCLHLRSKLHNAIV